MPQGKVTTLKGLANVVEDYALGDVMTDNDGQLIIYTGRKAGADGKLYDMNHMAIEGKTIESVERRETVMFITFTDKTCLTIEPEPDGILSVALDDPNRREE